MTPSRFLLAFGALLALALALPVLTGRPVAAGVSILPAVPGEADFNGDGIEDLAIGVAGEDIGAAADAGAVSVLYGTASGLGASGNQFWTQDNAGVPDSAEAGDNFGAGLAAGDYNGDGHGDLAVGAHLEDVGSSGNAGTVHVLYGSPGGLSATGNQQWTQDSAGIEGDGVESGDMFGASLAAGDFNGDGIADLAIGVREEDVDAANGAGAVNVLYGSPGGLTADGSQFWTQDSPDLAGEGAETGDVFSRGLGTGDFDGDGFDDLGVGAWEEDVGSITDAGAVNVLYGSAAGLTTDGNHYWTQDSSGVLDDPEENDWFGRPVTAGDFDGDGYDDVAIGAHREGVGAAGGAGAVHVLYGTAVGLTADGNQHWTQDSPDVEDQAEQGDHFARTAAAADLNGDGYADLAIGVSEEDVGSLGSAGAVNVLYGSVGGLVAAGDQFWTQDSGGVRDTAEADDLFGWYVQLGDLDGDGAADLAASAAYEDLGSTVDAGILHVLYGSGAGLTSSGSQLWSQNSHRVKDVAEAGDLFGVIME